MSVIKFTGMFSGRVSPDDILERAKDWNLDRVMVIGANKDNELEFGGSYLDRNDMIMLLEQVKHKILTAENEGEEWGIKP